MRPRSVRGGHGRAIAEYVQYQQLLKAGVIDPAPEIMVVAIDGNCSTYAQIRQEIERNTRVENRGRLVPACPDPHVERWFMADPASFRSVVGHGATVGRRKCVRDHCKRSLADAVRQAGHPATLGGLEFAADLVREMDFYRAGKNDASLRAFLDDLTAKLRQSTRVSTDRPGREGE